MINKKILLNNLPNKSHSEIHIKETLPKHTETQSQTTRTKINSQVFKKGGKSVTSPPCKTSIQAMARTGPEHYLPFLAIELL